MAAVEAGADGNAATRGRVVIADDDVLLREGLASLLEQVGLRRRRPGGRRGLSCSRSSASRKPHLAIVDIRMPPTHTTEGLDAARAIRDELPETAILLLSAHVDVEQAMDLLASGERSGYLLKSRVTDVDQFLDTLDRILKGSSAVDPALVQELVAARRVRDPLGDLSPREREVLELMAEGRSNSGIAHRLWVTEGTVEKHVHSILGKLRPARGRRGSSPRPRGDRVPRFPLGRALQEPADRAPGQLGLRYEPRDGCLFDQVDEVALGMR